MYQIVRPYMRISNFQFPENKGQNFLIQKGPFDFSEANFQIELRGLGAAGQTSRPQGIIKVGINFTFHMVLRAASHFQFLAGLMGKLSIVPQPRAMTFVEGLGTAKVTM